MSRSRSAKEPWKAPPDWEWLQLGTFAKLINGRAFKTSEWSSEGLPIIRIQNLNDGRRSFNFYRGTYEARHFVQKGDLLISWSGTPGTSFGAFVWAGANGLLNQHIFKVTFDRSRFVSEYLALAIQARIRDLIDLARGGVGLQHITKSTLGTCNTHTISS
jgi:restriction endonuclease S subunit